VNCLRIGKVRVALVRLGGGGIILELALAKIDTSIYIHELFQP